MGLQTVGALSLNEMHVEDAVIEETPVEDDGTVN